MAKVDHCPRRSVRSDQVHALAGHAHDDAEDVADQSGRRLPALGELGRLSRPCPGSGVAPEPRFFRANLGSRFEEQVQSHAAAVEQGVDSFPIQPSRPDQAMTDLSEARMASRRPNTSSRAASSTAR